MSVKDPNLDTVKDAWDRFTDVFSDWFLCQSGAMPTIVHAIAPPATEEERKARLEDLRRAIAKLSEEEGFACRLLQLEYRRLMCKRSIDARKTGPGADPARETPGPI